MRTRIPTRIEALVRSQCAIRIRVGVGVLLAAALACVPCVMPVVSAQSALEEAVRPGLGMEASPAELTAWHAADERRFIDAREQAEKILAGDARSYVAHLVLALVQHYGEANFPKALYHLERAEALFEARHGAPPEEGAPWRWHANLLKELANTHGDLEHHGEKLAYIGRYNALYEPDMIAERAWPLMKLGRYEQARRAARLGIATDRPAQHAIGYNALCAIEFEAGNDGASYKACKAALEQSRAGASYASAVDLTNFAEAARSLFRLDEAERIGLEATEAPVAWYGNPWMELAELYTREGRYMEALSALKEIGAYRVQRPPHVRDADRTEGRRALAAFLLVVGKAEEALRLTHKAMVAPDRRAHNSRDPAQDRIVVALLDRRARRALAERRLESAASAPWYMRPLDWIEAAWLRFEGWRSGAQAQTLVAEEERLMGTFKIGTASSAILPPWLAGELVEIAGPGIVQAALFEARASDARDGAEAYYDAFSAEAALARGNDELALAQARRALESLGSAEALLRARVQAVAAESARRLGRSAEAVSFYDRAFQNDPGVFRRLELAVPVHLAASSGAVAAEAAAMLERSPRVLVGEGGLALTIRVDGGGGEICLSGNGGSVLGCGRAEAKSSDDATATARRLVDAFHEQAFAPRLDLTQSDIHSLDGSNLIDRSKADSLLDGL